MKKTLGQVVVQCVCCVVGEPSDQGSNPWYNLFAIYIFFIFFCFPFTNTNSNTNRFQTNNLKQEFFQIVSRIFKLLLLFPTQISINLNKKKAQISLIRYSTMRSNYKTI